MRKKNRDQRYAGNVLDAPLHLDAEAWENNSILTGVKAAKEAPVCRCPGNRSEVHLGGCNPGLKFDEKGQLQAFCRCCQKDLSPRFHKRAKQRWVLGLACTYNKRPEQIDLGALPASDLGR